jgi:hypothetical protein
MSAGREVLPGYLPWGRSFRNLGGCSWGGRGSVGRGSAGRGSAGRGEAGFVGGFAGLLFGLLLFVAGTLLVAYAWAVIDTKSATVEAARQAARTYVQAPDEPAALAGAEQAAGAALAGYGRDPSLAQVSVVSGSFARCSRVTLAVSYPAPLFYLPFVGRVGSGVQVTSENSELVDPYRSGPSGVATCNLR